MRLATISLVIPIALGACAAPPNVVAGVHPADPTAKSAVAGYVPVTGGVKTFRPVEPKGWEELNRQVTPKAN